jgi:ClpP class serine protease
MNKPELISFSDFLMIAPFYDQRQFFAPEIEHMKGGTEALLASGLLKDEGSDLIEIDGSVAILTIEGPLRPGRDWYFSTGYGDIQDAIIELIDDSRIRTVIQAIDSPGGTVKQAFETHEMFEELAKEKRLISLVTGSATSAAALMTFPAEQRFLASKTAQTGSIGVVAEHVNNIAWYREMWGEIRTSVAKGELKDAGTDVRAYDEKAKKVFEESVAKLYDIFANEAARGLSLTREQVDAQQSQVFIGTDGITEGFADGFATLSDLITQAKTESFFSTPGRPAFSNIQTEDKRMDINQLKAEHPDVYQAALDDGKKLGLEASKETHTAEGQAAGILLERKRMNDIDALSLPPEFAAKAKQSSESAEHWAAEYLKAEHAKRKETAADMESDLNDGLDSDAPTPPKEPDGEEATDPVKDYKAAVQVKVDAGAKRTDAIKAVANENPELHQSYLKALNGGKDE